MDETVDVEAEVDAKAGAGAGFVAGASLRFFFAGTRAGVVAGLAKPFACPGLVGAATELERGRFLFFFGAGEAGADGPAEPACIGDPGIIAWDKDATGPTGADDKAAFLAFLRFFFAGTGVGAGDSSYGRQYSEHTDQEYGLTVLTSSISSSTTILTGDAGGAGSFCFALEVAAFS